MCKRFTSGQEKKRCFDTKNRRQAIPVKPGCSFRFFSSEKTNGWRKRICEFLLRALSSDTARCSIPWTSVRCCWMSNTMESRVSYSLTFVAILLIVTIVITVVIIPTFIITAAVVPASLFLPLGVNMAIISFFSAQVISSCLFLVDCA